MKLIFKFFIVGSSPPTVMKPKRYLEVDKFVEDISKSIEVIIWKNFPHVGEDDRADISQEVKFKIWKIVSSGKDIHNLRSYLWRVAYTTALDFINKKMEYVDFDEEREFDAVNCPSEIVELSSEILLEKKEVKTSLLHAVESLSQNRRVVLKLSLQGMSVNEIADFLGWSKSKVNHLYYRGLEDLKKRMKKG